MTVNCTVATTTLLIQTVAGFPATLDHTDAPLYVTARLGNYDYFTSTRMWLNPLDPTNSNVYVNISANSYYPHLTGTLIFVSFVDYYSDGQPSSAPFAGFSYRFEGPPTLLSIVGCDGSGQSTLNCVPDSSVLHLTGSGLLWFPPNGYGIAVNVAMRPANCASFNSSTTRMPHCRSSRYMAHY